jgi:hypothetical protein
MSHFSIRYSSNLAGAGGPKRPDPPPPPTLKPPKLGDLQAISSYEYVESIDLISDGAIDGLVNQRGEYVEDVGIFEGIYLEDAPIKQSSQYSGDASFTGHLSFIGSGFSGQFYENGEFVEKRLTSEVVANLTGSLSGISYSVLNSKLEIASSIYQDVLAIKSGLSNYSTNVTTQNVYYQQFRALNSKFNYNSVKEVQSYLLPDIPERLDSDYPFSCIKISFNNDGSILPLNESYGYDTVAILEDDVFNQVYVPLESTELQVRRFLPPQRKLNLTYFNLGADIVSDASSSYLNGSIYVFLYKENEVLLKNSIDAVIKNLKYLKVFSRGGKYNVGNASMEIRDGFELQKPLGSFSKTYSDRAYGIQLRGPFAKGRNIKSLLVGNSSQADASFNPNSSEGISGVNSRLFSDTISQEDADLIKIANTGLYNGFTQSGSGWLKTVDTERDKILNKGGSFQYLRSYLGTGNDTGILNFEYSASVLAYKDEGNRSKRVTSNPATHSVYFSINLSNKKFSESLGFKALNYSLQNLSIINSSNGGGFITGQNSLKNASIGLGDYNYRFLQTNVAALFKSAIIYATRTEGSDDYRGTAENVKFSDWNKEYIASYSEPAVATTHIVNNPNVDSVYLSFSIRVLRDIAHKNVSLKKFIGKAQDVEAGTSIPSIISFKIELGYQTKDGNEVVTESREYQVRGSVESPVTIDIGREENNTSQIIQKYSRFIVGSDKSVAAPLVLPPYQPDQLRFVRVYRTTYESYSSLVKREITLEKVTEVVNLPFSYPYSTICGLKLDARSLPQIPARSYDARFKKVFVPSNYFPLLPNGKDKRYLTAAEFASATTEEKRVYDGNWDGTFKLAWTDNPAWILFDLLINRRYGLGNFINPDQVNYWELYKIGRYCDAVDGDGLFVGVPSASGGKEPRYGFNGAIADKTNVFDMIQSIVASFRGNMFYSNSEINFTNDRLKPIMAQFNNANVKDGIFSYTNSRRDLQYNVVEVSYLDRDDLFKEKIEYVEDPDDIKVRGILRTSAQTFGVTSRAHAQRIGQHIIYSTINEDQNVQFSAGLETLLCRPGDLIAINDELRTLKKYVGRVLDIDLANNIIHTNIGVSAESFSPTGLTGQISILVPTGKYQSDDFYNLAKSPSKLNIAEIYQTDIPQYVSLNATGYDFSSYGVKLLLDPSSSNSGLPLLQQAKIGTPCSITLANTAQEIYKIQSIKELNLNEYEVVASKFDTGKFAEIEAGESLNEFFNYFPSVRDTFVNEGSGFKVSNQFIYELTGVPLITTFTTGNFDAQNDIVDISGAWQEVNGANSYNVELISPKYRSTKVQTTGNSITFEDQAEVGNYTLKVTAVQTGIYPNPISATHAKTFKVLSYVAPKRSNGTVVGFKVNTAG